MSATDIVVGVLLIIPSIFLYQTNNEVRNIVLGGMSLICCIAIILIVIAKMDEVESKHKHIIKVPIPQFNNYKYVDINSTLSVEHLCKTMNKNEFMYVYKTQYEESEKKDPIAVFSKIS